MSEFDMKRTGCTFNPMSADYRVGYESGARYQQVKIDAITKQRDSFIKAHHIATNDVCEHKAKIDELQARVDVYELHIKTLKNIHENDFNEESESSYILGNLDGFFECLESDLGEIE